MIPLLFINDTYCATFEHLKTILSEDKNQKDSNFRKEILSYYLDGILEEWIMSQGENNLDFSFQNTTDDEIFKNIVKAVTGNEVTGDISSRFNDIGEILSIECEGKNYPISNGIARIYKKREKTEATIKVVFKCLKSENNDFTFSFGTQTVTQNWKDFNKGQEVVYEFSTHESGEYELKEGKDNKICKICLGVSNGQKKVKTEEQIIDIPKGAVDLGLSVYWADKDISRKKIKNKNFDIEAELGKGWRLPTYSEVEELQKSKLSMCESYSFYGNKNKNLFLSNDVYYFTKKDNCFFHITLYRDNIQIVRLNAITNFHNTNIRAVFDKK